MAFSTHDQVPDSPTNTFATLNPLIGSLTGTMSDGNLKYSSGAVHDGLRSNIYVSTGKWYFETILISQVSGLLIGISSIDENVYESGNLGNYEYKNTIRYYSGNGRLYYHTGSTSTNVAYGDSWTNGDVIGVYLNLEDNELFFYKNGTAQNSGTAINLNSSTYNLGTLNFTARFDEGSNVNTTASVFAVNFGQDHLFGGATLPSGAGSNTPDNGIGTFAFSVPTGAKALCTANLPDPSINPALDELPEDNFKAVLYTGQTVGGAMTSWNGTTGTVDVGFQPDLVWIKSRTAGGSDNHSLIDSIRGATYGLHSDTTQGQWTDPTTLTALNSNGFSLGTHTVVNGSTNYVAWCWRAGGNSNTFNINGTGYSSYDNLQSANSSLPASSTSGMITPTAMSVGVKQGFSIVKYVGAGTSNARTIPHGLSDTPDLIIIKDLDGSNDWIIWFQGFGADSYLRLNTSAAKSTVSNAWGGSPNSNTFSVYQSGAHNTSGRDYIAYCWHSVAGYSAFGSYTGNGSATSGPFIFTGFKPALIWIKCTSDSTTTHTSWSIYDNAREPNNVMNKPLYANKSAAEGERGNGTTDATDIKIDFLSNGFRILTDKEELNDDGETYIFCCWAEMPQKYSATNAR